MSRIATLILSPAAILATGCLPRVVVDSDDRTPPVLTIHISPGASYTDGTAFANPVDVERDVAIAATSATDMFRFNAVGQDPESAIRSVEVTLGVRVSCRAFLSPNEPPTDWSRVLPLWTFENGEPDPDGTETYDRGNVIAMVNLDGFWRRAECGNGPTGDHEVTRGRVVTVSGTYAARACNNSAVAGSQCASASGRFSIRGADSFEIEQ